MLLQAKPTSLITFVSSEEYREIMLRVAIILGSTRPGRKGEAVAQWVYDIAKKKQRSNKDDAEFEYVDIKDFNLPLLDEPTPPSQGQYSKDHTKGGQRKSILLMLMSL